MSRRLSREAIFKVIYQYCITGNRDDFTYEDLIGGMDIESDNRAYTKTVYEGVLSHFEELKRRISEWSEGFVFERIYKVDLAILLVALYEIYYMEDIPFSVSINEAVELSKTYSTEKSATFINGILASAVKEQNSGQA